MFKWDVVPVEERPVSGPGRSSAGAALSPLVPRPSCRLCGHTGLLMNAGTGWLYCVDTAACDLRRDAFNSRRAAA